VKNQDFNELPSVEVLRATFRVDEHSRLLRWDGTKGWHLASKIQKGRSYFTAQVGGKSYLAHRIIWKMHHGREPSGVIDHVNGCPLDNRIENLREASHAQNSWNAKRAFPNSTGFRNVMRHRDGYRGRLCVNYAMKFTPTFEDPELAELAAAELSRVLHGEFSVERRAA
jgi:hypothetical protein